MNEDNENFLPGWYPDYEDTSRERYFTTKWTNQVRDKLTEKIIYDSDLAKKLMANISNILTKDELPKASFMCSYNYYQGLFIITNFRFIFLTMDNNNLVKKTIDYDRLESLDTIYLKNNSSITIETDDNNKIVFNYISEQNIKALEEFIINNNILSQVEDPITPGIKEEEFISGWYTDYKDSTKERYYDGENWTESIRDKNPVKVTSVDGGIPIIVKILIPIAIVILIVIITAGASEDTSKNKTLANQNITKSEPSSPVNNNTSNNNIAKQEALRKRKEAAKELRAKRAAHAKQVRKQRAAKKAREARKKAKAAKQKRARARAREQRRKEAQTDTRYSTCADAKDNGNGPYTDGEDPEYDWYIDRDSDGVVCE